MSSAGARSRLDALFSFSRFRSGPVVESKNPWNDDPQTFHPLGELDAGVDSPQEVPAPKAVPKEWLSEKERDRTLLWFHIGRGLHFFGQYAFAIAQPLFLFMLVKDGVITGISGAGAVSVALGLGSLGYFVLAFAGGALVGRFGPKRVLIGLIMLMTVTGLALPAFYAAGITPLWLMLGINVFATALGAVHTVGETTLVPGIIGWDPVKLQKTNVILEVTFGIMAAAAALLGGYLVDSVGPLAVFVGYSVLHLVVVLPIYWKKLPSFTMLDKSGPRIPAGERVRQALRLVVGNKAMLALFGLLAAYEFLVVPFHQALLPIINDMAFAGAGTLLGLAVASFYIGYTLANLLSRKYSKFSALMRWLRLAGVGMLLMVGFGIAPLTPTTFIIAPGLLAFLTGPGRTTLKTLIQSKVHNEAPERLPMVMGFYTAISALVAAIGLAAIGLLSTSLSPVFPALFWWMAPFFALAAAAYWWAPRILERERDK